MRRTLVMLFVLVASSTAPLIAEDPWYTEGDWSPAVRVKLTLTNTLDFDRVDCPIIVPSSMLPSRDITELSINVVDPALPGVPQPTKEELALGGGHRIQQETNGHQLYSQYDDIDHDGLGDEFFFMTDLKARETKTLYLYLGFSQRGWNVHGTHGAIGSYSHHLIPFWESENVGWKLWYPTDCDLYGKRKNVLMANELYMKNLNGYAVPWDYGSDIMRVEDSFGAGGICLFERPDAPDSLSRPRFGPWYRTGPVTDTRYSFQVVASGPLRSIVRAHTFNWRSGAGEYELVQDYTAYTNKLYSTCAVKYLKFIPLDGGTAFGCGIRKIMYETESFHEGGVAISIARNMPLIDPNTETIDRRRATLAFAGTALVVREALNPVYREVASFQGNHTFRIPATSDLSYGYLIASSWSEGPMANTPEKFKEYVLGAAMEYNNPIMVGRCVLEKRPDGYKPLDYWGPAEVHKLRD